MKFAAALQKTRLSLVVAAVLAVAVGCKTPTGAVTSFATASSAAAHNIRDAFQQIDETTIERKMSEVASSSTERPAPDTFTGVFKQNQLKPRLALVSQIGAYSAALGKLATADFKSEVDAAAADLYGALGGLAKTYGSLNKGALPLDENALKIIVTAVEAFGNALTEAKRRQALKAVVRTADPGITLAAQAVAADLTNSDITQFVVANLESTYTDLVAAYGRETAQLTYAKRLEFLTKIRAANLARESAQQLLPSAAKSAQQMAAAHKALKTAVEKSKFNTAELIEAITELAVTAAETKEFYHALKAK